MLAANDDMQRKREQMRNVDSNVECGVHEKVDDSLGCGFSFSWNVMACDPVSSPFLTINKNIFGQKCIRQNQKNRQENVIFPTVLNM